MYDRSRKKNSTQIWLLSFHLRPPVDVNNERATMGSKCKNELETSTNKSHTQFHNVIFFLTRKLSAQPRYCRWWISDATTSMKTKSHEPQRITTVRVKMGCGAHFIHFLCLQRCAKRWFGNLFFDLHSRWTNEGMRKNNEFFVFVKIANFFRCCHCLCNVCVWRFLTTTLNLLGTLSDDETVSEQVTSTEYLMLLVHRAYRVYLVIYK